MTTDTHSTSLPPTYHRSTSPSAITDPPLPFHPRNQVRVPRPSTAASHVDAIPYRWAIPQHSTVGSPALRQQRANANVDVTLASTYLRY
jgi:hypothetical protein